MSKFSIFFTFRKADHFIWENSRDLIGLYTTSLIN
jgi:hypothetical protein